MFTVSKTWQHIALMQCVSLACHEAFDCNAANPLSAQHTPNYYSMALEATSASLHRILGHTSLILEVPLSKKDLNSEQEIQAF